MNQTRAADLIEAYETLLNKCYELARADDGALMGDSKWLRNAISDSDIQLSAWADGIHCYGMTYTVQTMDYEFFEFTIPYDLLKD